MLLRSLYSPTRKVLARRRARPLAFLAPCACALGIVAAAPTAALASTDTYCNETLTGHGACAGYATALIGPTTYEQNYASIGYNQYGYPVCERITVNGSTISYRCGADPVNSENDTYDYQGSTGTFRAYNNGTDAELMNGIAEIITEESPTQSGATAISALNPDVAQSFSAFDRPEIATDTLPTEFVSTLGQLDGGIGAEPSLAQKVIASDGEVSYLVPASGGLCVANANEAFCSDDQRLAGAEAIDLCSPSLPAGQLELEWVLPDGATSVELRMSDGAATTEPAGDNVYIADLPLSADAPLPTTIAWEDASGRHSVKTRIPANARSMKCATTP